jgi:hypothetical protein
MAMTLCYDRSSCLRRNATMIATGLFVGLWALIGDAGEAPAFIAAQIVGALGAVLALARRRITRRSDSRRALSINRDLSTCRPVEERC